jgi:hypothetical protein
MSGIEFFLPCAGGAKILSRLCERRQPRQATFSWLRQAVGDTGESDYVFDQVFDDASDQAASRE